MKFPSPHRQLALCASLALLLLCLASNPIPSQVHGQNGIPALYLKTGTVDTSIAPDLRSAEASGPYFIVQFAGPIRTDWRTALQASGAQILDYLPDYAYIVRSSGKLLTSLSKLPGVRWSGPYLPEYKLAAELADSQEEEADVLIQVFAGEAPQTVSTAIERAGGRVRSASRGELAGYVRAHVPTRALAGLAALPAVSWIERYHQPSQANNVARSSAILAVNPVWEGLELYGAGQIIAIADTGLDTGNVSTLHPDLRGRLLKAYALGRAGDWSDPDGHGTHVAGSALGDGVMSGSNPAQHNYASSFAGVAPEAHLVLQSVLDKNDKLTGIPDNLNDLFAPPYQDGARVHSNSWGDAQAGAYDLLARQADEFLWTHRDMTILFAAGNDGIDANGNGMVDPDSINTPGTAKNVITVGATENYRPHLQDTYGVDWPSDFPAEPIADDSLADDAGGMAAFSSRGPTDDGRIKPDLVAPGTYVISTRSQVATDSGWEEYNAHYLYLGGTSMATPLAAGAAAIVRQAYVQTGLTNPSAALVKATLIHSAQDISPGQYGAGNCQEIPSRQPNNVMGWGRLNLRDSLMPSPPRQVRYLDQNTGLYTGQSQTFTFTAANPSQVGCGEGVSNGGFESTTTSWQSEGNTSFDAFAHQGLRSARLGGGDNSADQLWQEIQIPADISDGEISFWLYQTSWEILCGYDYFWAEIEREDGTSASILIAARDGTATTSAWHYLVHRLTPEEVEDIRGHRVRLNFRITTDLSGPTTVRIDDVQFVLCTQGGRLKPDPFRATLVWSDYPGAVGAAKSLVNDLDLEVIDPLGVHLYGNGGTGADRVNNVEGVLIPNPQPGPYQVVVRAFNVPQGPQPYALLVSLDETQPAATGAVSGTVTLYARTDHSAAVVSVGAMSTTSGSNGRFFLSDIPAGTYSVTAAITGYLYAQKPDVVITANITTTLPAVQLLGGDTDGNCTVDLFDLIFVAMRYGSRPPSDPRADINGNGEVDIYDLVATSWSYGRSCPLPWQSPNPLGARAASSAYLQVLPAHAQGEVGQLLTVSLELKDVNDLYGVDVQLTFDPHLLQVVDADPQREGVQIRRGTFPDPALGTVTLDVADNEQGAVRYAISLLNNPTNPVPPAQGSGTLCTIAFRTEAEGYCLLHIASANLAAASTGAAMPIMSADGSIQVGSRDWLYLPLLTRFD